MSTAPPALNPISLRYPFELKDQPPEVVQAHRYTFQGLVDLNQAIAAMKSQLEAVKAGATTIVNQGGGGGIIPGPPVLFPFPGLGAVNDQTGNTSYTVTSMDNGILLIFNDASPIAVSLNSALTTPYFFFATNFGVGAVTFTPTSGSVIGVNPMTTGELLMIVFDGVNWKTSDVLTISGANFVQETPTPAPNGVTTIFTTTFAPNPPASGIAYVNGVEQDQTRWVTLSGSTWTFTVAPKSTDFIRAIYTH